MFEKITGLYVLKFLITHRFHFMVSHSDQQVLASTYENMIDKNMHIICIRLELNCYPGKYYYY